MTVALRWCSLLFSFLLLGKMETGWLLAPAVVGFKGASDAKKFNGQNLTRMSVGTALSGMAYSFLVFVAVPFYPAGSFFLTDFLRVGFLGPCQTG